MSVGILLNDNNSKKCIKYKGQNNKIRLLKHCSKPFFYYQTEFNFLFSWGKKSIETLENTRVS